MITSSKTVFTGANIVTLSESLPQAEAICVSNGRIDCIGSRHDVLNYAACGGKESVNIIELGGGFLYPGFIDTHSHLSSYADCLDQVWCGSTPGGIASVITRLREQTHTSTPEGWIIGYGYDDTGVTDNRHLSRQDLDKVSTDRPVLVKHISVHLGYANTLALKKLGFSADTHIPGGEIPLDAVGEPAGVLFENAFFKAWSQLPIPTPEQTRKNLLLAITDYNKQGFTTFHDGGVGLTGDPELVLSSYSALARDEKLHARAYLHMMPAVMDKLAPFGLWNFKSDYLTLGGVKYFTDGSIQGFTAALQQPYHARPDWKGKLVFPPKEIEEVILKYFSRGIPIAVHVNGDAAIEVTLQAFEKAQRTFPDIHQQNMLVHAQTASDAQLARMKACGIIPTLFARHIEEWGDRHHDIFLGPERTERLDPAGSCVKLDMPFSLHVDTPVLPVTALGSMHAAVNRISSSGRLLGAQQRISPLDALKAYTTHASLCCQGESDRGCLEPGRFADFVLLSDDLLHVPPSSINNLEVRMTVCGGRIVYQK